MLQLPPRPLWLAGLVGWLASATLATGLTTAYMAYYDARMDDAHMFECNACVRPDASMSAAWWHGVTNTFVVFAVVYLLLVGVLLVRMRILEREQSRSLTVWILTSVLISTPLAIAGLLTELFFGCSGGCRTTMVFDPWVEALVTSCAIYVLAFSGGAAAWGIRHCGRA